MSRLFRWKEFLEHGLQKTRSKRKTFVSFVCGQQEEEVKESRPRRVGPTMESGQGKIREICEKAAHFVKKTAKEGEKRDEKTTKWRKTF